MTDQGNPTPLPAAPAAPAGWHVNPSTGQREYWDGAAWTQPPARTPIAPLALTALIVGGAAFLFGLVPILGLLLAIAGLVLGIIALVRKARPTWMPAVGLAAAGVALITSIIVVAAFANGLSNVAQTTNNPPSTQETREPAEPTEPALPIGQAQAVAKAQSYLEVSPFSRAGLIDQLEFEGFETADATFAVDYIDVDWNEQAALKAQQYLDTTSFSKQSLTDQLLFEGFTEAEAAYGVKAVGF